MALKAEGVRYRLDLTREGHSRSPTNNSDVFCSNMSYSENNTVKGRLLKTSN